MQELLKEREENFKDHIEKKKKKIIVALQRIFHPFTVLTLAYIGFLIYNTHLLYTNQNQSKLTQGGYLVNQRSISYINSRDLIIQHIITIIVVLVLVAIDVYIRIQRLNFRVFNIDSKIQQVIDRFQTYIKEMDKSEEGHFKMNHQEAEFAYYQKCFSWTLRNEEWKKIPNNTLAEGDIIKLLPDDTAPAIVETLLDNYQLHQQLRPKGDIIKLQHDDNTSVIVETLIDNELPKGVAEPLAPIKIPSPMIGQGIPQSTKPVKLYFNKGRKIQFRGVAYQASYSANNASDPHEAFEKSMKEYILFKVYKTPCVQDLTEYISNMETRKSYSNNLLYFQNVQMTEKFLTIFLAVCWVACVTIDIALIYTGNLVDYFDHHMYLVLIGFSFIVTQIFWICEAWANSLMITLFNSLQFDDYNKHYSDEKNLIKHMKKPQEKKKNGGNVDSTSTIPLEKPLVTKKTKVKKSASEPLTLMGLLTCKCLRGRDHKKRKSGTSSRRKNSTSKKRKEKITRFVKTDDFYEIYNFQNRGIRKNWTKFWEFYRSGCTHINNIFASLSCVSVFAFVDKEGIISEAGKYVDEIAAIGKHEQKVVLDLLHDSHVTNEESVYSFENANLYQDNLPLLRALGLAFMCSRNPKESDTEKQMLEVFTKHIPSSSISGNIHPLISEEGPQSGIKNDIGFHFHNALRQETETHQDCVCALSKLIGHSDASFHNYDQMVSVWNILHNPQLGDPTRHSDKDNELGKEVEDKKHRSFDDQEKLSEENSLDLISEGGGRETIRSEQSSKVIDVFAAQKQHKKMLLERINKFGHVVQTIALDKSTNQFQSFSRGEASIIFNMCSDYWNGEKIVPIKKEAASHIKDILFQWQASDFIPIGFSYKPVTPDVQALINDKKLKPGSQSMEVKETLESFQKNQIFLGIIGVKNHKKQEANKLFQSLNDAGIRGVLFSKEGVLETRSLGKELGIDSDWNAWISLAEQPSDYTKLYNVDGHLILPYGIPNIQKHIKDVDKIPLQVPMFCDSTAETTRQMFQIYQENGDVVACIGNIINSENLHIFQQANIAIGMMIEPSYRCYRCNGRISKAQLRQSTFKRDAHYHIHPQQQQNAYNPSKLEQLSAAINALACTFVFDANTNIYCFFSVFREARRLRESVEQACLLAIFISLNIFLLLFVDFVLGLHNYCEQLEILYILCIFIPLFSFSCMARATKNSVMKRHVLSEKYLQYLDYAIFMIKSNIFKVLLSTCVLYSVRILYLQESVQRFKESYPNDYKVAFFDQIGEKSFNQQVKYLLYGNWYDLKIRYPYWQQTMQLEHKFNFCFLLIIITYLCIGLESTKSTLFYKFTSNKVFRIMLALQLLFIIAYYALSITVFQDSSPGIYYPSYRVWLCALGALIVIGIADEVTKKHVRKLFERDHNRLSIFFSTKLGMWSPR